MKILYIIILLLYVNVSAQAGATKIENCEYFVREKHIDISVRSRKGWKRLFDSKTRTNRLHLTQIELDAFKECINKRTRLHGGKI